MHVDTNSLNSVGFRHVLEDALDILEGKDLPQQRREFVLRDLAEVVSEAKKCSDQVSGQAWFHTNANQEAYELFSLIETSLEREGKPWRNWLESAAAVLDGLAKGAAAITEQQRTNAALFLKAVLTSVSSLPKIKAIKDADVGARLRHA